MPVSLLSAICEEFAISADAFLGLGRPGSYNGKPFARGMTIEHPACDLTGKLSMHHLFLLMQEAAGDDSERVGFGREFMTREGVFWVLSRVSVTVKRMPLWLERVRLRTWHLPTVRYVYPRDFLMEDESGECLLTASTLWILIDKEKREIVLPSRRGFVMREPPQGMPKIAPPGKLLFPFEPDQSVARVPCYSDFDNNGHMNNARYPLWICDLFPASMYKSRRMDALQINFMREILEGERVELAHGIRENQFVLRGIVEGDTRFEAMGSFRDVDRDE